MVLEQWGCVTGETKVNASDARVIVFGDRSGNWIDEAEQSDFAGLEEPFAVIHKAIQFNSIQFNTPTGETDAHAETRPAQTHTYSIHKATLNVLYRERNKDAAPRART